jgi:1-deoxy-D-xylulose-5-phosphate synthase
MEKDKVKWHEHAAFDIETGDPLKASAQSVEGLAVQTLMQLAEKDPSIVGLTAAMAAGTGMNKFGEKFPARFYDVGIAEEHGVTFSAGLAAEGMKPFVAIYSPFLQRAFDEMMHDVSMMNLPVKFLIPKSAITGDGPTQGGILDISYTRILPHFVVMAPKDEVELQHMVKTAHEYNKGPVAVRYPKGTSTSEAIPLDKLQTIPIGKAEVVKDGKDVTLFAIGWMVRDAQKAAEELEKKGISAAVINARFAKPLDEKLLVDYAKKTGNIITLEENTLVGGFGSAVLECLEKNNMVVNVKRIGGADDYIPYDKPENIKKKFGMSVEDIVNTAIKMKGKK